MAEPTSSGQHVLMKDQSKIKKAIRKTTIVMNSRDRNLLSYPNSSQYKYTFRRPLTNIMSIELMSGSVPALIYNINTGWNRFTFREKNTSWNVTIPPGFYTDVTLAAAVAPALNGLSGIINTYTGSVDPITKKFTLSRSAGVEAFWFLFASGDIRDDVDRNYVVMSVNTPDRILGFGINDYSDSGGAITAPFPMDLENFGNRIYMYINGDNNMDLHRMELAVGRRDPFHIFFLSPGAYNYLQLDKETYTAIYESSPAPLARMSGLEVSFRDEFYRLVDFQGREVNLVFEITHLE